MTTSPARTPPPIFRVPSRGDSPVYMRCATPPNAFMRTLGHCRSASIHRGAAPPRPPVALYMESEMEWSEVVVGEKLPSGDAETERRGVGGAQPPAQSSGVCPICIEPILAHQDVMTLGCAGRTTSSQPHQIHCTPCSHQWLASTDVVRGVICPVCRDHRAQLSSMTPGGSYQLHGGVCILAWPASM